MDTSVSWTPVKNYPLYEVSDNGKIRPYGSPTEIRCSRMSDGRAYVTLVTGRNSLESRFLDELVLSSFDREPCDEEKTWFKDGDVTNASLSNLTYAQPRLTPES